MAHNFLSLSVPQLKAELKGRGAVTHGRKIQLLERLQSYDRNKNFGHAPILLPEPLDVDWPSGGFQQLQANHKNVVPDITKEQIDAYFLFRLAGDKQCSGDLKALEKGESMIGRILAVSIVLEEAHAYFTGIVSAAMKNKVTYSFKIKIEKISGDPLNSHCECPAGRGPHGTCKHLAAVLLMLKTFKETGALSIQKTCTENLQTFHKPKFTYSGSPVKAEDLPMRKRIAVDDDLDDPRPVKFRNNKGYPDFVLSSVTNYCAKTSQNIAFRYLYAKADIQTAMKDHTYLEKPFTEFWIDSAVQVTPEQVMKIEEETRDQASSSKWHEERCWRLTASRFGEICSLTARRNVKKFCFSLATPLNFTSNAMSHGKLYEAKAIKSFEQKYNLKVKKSGFFICISKPFLGASPDGLVDLDSVVEVKCPYNGRQEFIEPGPNFNFLTFELSEIVLRKSHKYYDQIQGQLYITKRACCYFIVYTFKDMFVQKIAIDQDYCEKSLIPKLDLFYSKYYMPYLASSL